MNWKQFNLHNFVPILFFILGMIAGLIYPIDTKPTKHYPIEVECHWSTGYAQGYPTMEADSVKGNTIYKDGLGIVSNNIINIKFK
jgi:hypothetical protein